MQFKREYNGSEIISYANIRFDWRNIIDWKQLEDRFPGAKWFNIAKLVNELEDPIDDHLVLMMGDIYYDMSWDPSMERLGFLVKEYGDGIAIPEKAIIDINEAFFDESRYLISRKLRKIWHKIKKPEEGKFNKVFNTILYLNRCGVELVEIN